MFTRLERDAFIRALNDRKLIDRVQLMCPQDIDDAARLAHEYEEQEARGILASTPSSSRTADSVRTVLPTDGRQQQQKQPKPVTSDIEKLMSALTTMKSELNARMDDLQARTAAAQSSGSATSSGHQVSRSSKRTDLTCRLCGKVGHFKIDCPLLSPDEKKRILDYRARRGRRQFSQSTGSTSTSSQAASGSNIEVNQDQPKPQHVGTLTGEQSLLYYTVVYIGGQQFRVMLDLGAGVSILDNRFVPDGMHVDRTRSDIAVKAGNDTFFRVDGAIDLKFRLSPDEEEYTHPMVVSPDMDDIIFGNDLLRKLDFECSLKDGSMQMMGKPRVMHPVPIGPTVRRIYTAVEVTIDARHKADVPDNIPRSHAYDRAPALYSEACEIGPGVVAANVVLPGYTSEAKIKILNMNNKPFTIPTGRLLATAYPYISLSQSMVGHLYGEECQRAINGKLVVSDGNVSTAA